MWSWQESICNIILKLNFIYALKVSNYQTLRPKIKGVDDKMGALAYTWDPSSPLSMIDMRLSRGPRKISYGRVVSSFTQKLYVCMHILHMLAKYMQTCLCIPSIMMDMAPGGTHKRGCNVGSTHDEGVCTMSLMRDILRWASAYTYVGFVPVKTVKKKKNALIFLYETIWSSPPRCTPKIQTWMGEWKYLCMDYGSPKS